MCTRINRLPEIANAKCAFGVVRDSRENNAKLEKKRLEKTTEYIYIYTTSQQKQGDNYIGIFF